MLGVLQRWVGARCTGGVGWCWVFCLRWMGGGCIVEVSLC